MAFTSLSLPDDLDTRLDALAQRSGRPKTFYILEAIREHLDDLEDAHDADIIMKRVREGKEALYTSDEVGKMIGVDN